MNYIAEPNLVLETLIYLAQRANNHDQCSIESRLPNIGDRERSLFQKRCKPINTLRQKLDSQIDVSQELLESLFTDLGGFPQNSVGAYSPAILLFGPAASQHDGDLEEFLDKLSRYTSEQVARDLLISFDFSQHFPPEGDKYTSLLKKLIPSLPFTKRGKQSFIRAQKNYAEVLEQTALCLRPAYAVIESLREELQQLTREHASEISNPDVENYLWSSGVFALKKETAYHIRPLVIEPGSNLFFDMASPDSQNVIYCGVLQSFMRGLQGAPGTSKEHLFECMHLLGDQTRFEILCYLHNHPAYGQELSDHFGLARNTISHHMSKLFEAGLIRCNYKGARVYYSIDKNHFRRLLDQQKKMFID